MHESKVQVEGKQRKLEEKLTELQKSKVGRGMVVSHARKTRQRGDKEDGGDDDDDGEECSQMV